MLEPGDAEEPEDIQETINQYATTRPGMIAVRRRTHRRRQKPPSDVHFRNVRIALLVVVIGLIVYMGMPDFLRQKFFAEVRQVFKPFRGLLQLRLDIIALVVAAGVLLYLTPGVEDYVLRLLGIRRDKKRR